MTSWEDLPLPVPEGFVFPPYLRDNLNAVDLNLSTALREEIVEVDALRESMLPEEMNRRFHRILDLYESECAPKKKHPCESLSLLTILFWHVTQRTKIGATAKRHGIPIPYWGKDVFNFPIILGRATEPGVQPILWQLTSGEGLKNKVRLSTVVSVYRVTKEIFKQRPDLPMELILKSVIVLARQYDRTGKPGIHRIETAVLRKALSDHFGIRLKVAEPPEEAKDSTVALERTKNGASSDPTKPTGSFYNEEVVRITAEMRKLLQRLTVIRVESLPEEYHESIQDEMRGMIDSAFSYLDSKCRRIASQHKAIADMGLEVALHQERLEYEAACAYFGHKVGRKGVLDFDRQVKKLYRQQASALHPDRNPGMESAYHELNRNREIILSYNSKYQGMEAR